MGHKAAVASRRWQWPTESVTEADSLITTWEAAEELSVDHSIIIQHLKQIGKMKKLYKWVPCELMANQKNCCFEVSSSLVLYSNNEPFLHQILMRDEKWMYNIWRWPTQWLDQEAPGHFLKPSLYQKWSRSLFGGLLLDWYIITFWILVKTLSLRSMLSKLMNHTESCNACSQCWSTERAWFFSMTMPDYTPHNGCFKSWTNCVAKFCFIWPIHLSSCQLTTSSSSILTNFCRENVLQPAGGRKCFPRVRQILKAHFFMLQEETIYFSLAKMYWL